jgi:hypothetical protein
MSLAPAKRAAPEKVPASARPHREVEDNLLTSSANPGIKGRVGDSFTYLGRLQFELYSVAEVEVFVFVDAGESDRLKRMFIAQFEGYLESNDHVYEYPLTHAVKLGTHEYVHDTFVYSVQKSLERAGSDSSRTLGFISERGYVLPAEAFSSRFVYLLYGRRREMLFSYMEDLAPLRYSLAEISQDNRLKSGYEALADGLLERALAAFEIVQD